LEGDATRFVAVQTEDKKWAIAWDADGRFSKNGVAEEVTDPETEPETVRTEGVAELTPRPEKWVPVMLHRKMQLGMESRYVKGANG
jgi:hypothetical protein